MPAPRGDSHSPHLFFLPFPTPGAVIRSRHPCRSSTMVRAPAFQAGDAGSIPVCGSMNVSWGRDGDSEPIRRPFDSVSHSSCVELTARAHPHCRKKGVPGGVSWLRDGSDSLVHQKVVRFDLAPLYIGGLCNGSTRDFDSLRDSSNLSPSAIIFAGGKYDKEVQHLR